MTQGDSGSGSQSEGALESGEQNARPRANARYALLRAAVAVSVLAAAGAAAFWMLKSPPGAETGGERSEAAPLVETVRVERRERFAEIRASGEVAAARRVEISPRVAGRIVHLSPDLAEGERVESGETLARLDDGDYRDELAGARADLKEAEADLALERGAGRAAEAEAEKLEGLSGAERSLVLREPQADKAEARVKRAKASVRRAERQVARTTLAAPFDAVVSSVDAELGGQASVGASIATLYGADAYHVDLAVAPGKLDLIRTRRADKEGSRVSLRKPSAWGPGESREGEVLRVLPGVTTEGAMALVRVAVSDPLDAVPALLVGQYVNARIAGRSLGSVVALDSRALRSGDSVWVVDGGELEMRAVQVVHRTSDEAFVSVGLADGERVVTSALDAPVDGMDVRARDGGGRE